MSVQFSEMNRKQRSEKLKTLADDEGYANVSSMIEARHTDSVVPGICTNSDCNYSTDVEPDQSGGYCENCSTRTVASCLMLAGIV